MAAQVADKKMDDEIHGPWPAWLQSRWIQKTTFSVQPGRRPLAAKG